MYWHEGMGGVGWWGLGLGMVIFWVLVIVAVVLAVRWPTAQARPTAPPTGWAPQHDPVPRPASDARRILDERLARGEIDEETYRRTRALVDGG